MLNTRSLVLLERRFNGLDNARRCLEHPKGHLMEGEVASHIRLEHPARYELNPEWGKAEYGIEFHIGDKVF